MKPQSYEEVQIQETEYTYAALAADVNIYDSVLEQNKGNGTHNGDYNESSFGVYNTGATQEDNYSMCEDGQETRVYSKLAQK